MLVIIQGPKGCGKTRNAEAFKKLFNCQVSFDGWRNSRRTKNPWEYEAVQIGSEDNGLMLTHEEIDEKDIAYFRDMWGVVQVSDFDEAMSLLHNTNFERAVERVSQVTGLPPEFIVSTLNDMSRIQEAIHAFNIKMGWWDKPREDGTCMMLIVSEIAEAMEGNRKNRQDDHLPHLKNEPVELSDAIIRIFDYAGRKKFNLSGALIEKWAYNADRADHKKENREKDGGKKY
jgi:hypothetical protein